MATSPPPDTVILNLGKALLATLSEPAQENADVTLRWMITHVAGLMDRCEAEGPICDASLLRECREAILAFWQYRYSFERGKRPFEQFEVLAASLHNRNRRTSRGGNRQSKVLEVLDRASAGYEALTDIAIALEGEALSESISEQELTLASAATDAGQGGPDLTFVSLLLAEGKRLSSSAADDIAWLGTRIAAAKDLIASAEDILRRVSSHGELPL
jgi:hypothetical protein